jgi:hypothetical protein
VSFVPGYGVINFEGCTNLSCPFCSDCSFTSLLNFTRAVAGCDVGFPLGSGFGRRSVTMQRATRTQETITQPPKLNRFQQHT